MFRGKWSWLVKGLEARSFKKGCVWNKFKMQAVTKLMSRYCTYENNRNDLTIIHSIIHSYADECMEL